MYTPFIRAKQFDLDALRELPTELINSGQVIPIIEPVVTIKTNQFKKLSESNYKFILITNPSVGIYKSVIPNATIVNELVNNVYSSYSNYVLGFVIHSNTTLKDVDNFIKKFPNHLHAFIHEYSFANPKELNTILLTDKKREFNIFIEGHSSSDYNSKLSSKKSLDILISDGFTKQINNASYPPEDFFLDLHLTYLDRGYDGFGDYTIMGKRYDTSGGPAHAVAIHFTYLYQKELWLKHFVSDDKKNPTNPGGKFLQALEKLKKFLSTNTKYSTVGANEFRSLSNFQGLGMVKKYSMKHHIELIYGLLK